MEEPVFVKCEPGWLSEGEETCDFEQQKDVTDNLQVKIEPDDILAVSNMEEVNLEIVREEHNTEEMPPAARSEESSLSGVPTHENRLEAAEMWIWWKMTRTSWTEKKTNLEVLREVK
ncbi:uncharacterized protein [Anabrus simplex]|uniref:uncharacterized protein n=1 Tax=Anabrus simplex TaxID=316456 RepID=UPI0035A39AC0